MEDEKKKKRKFIRKEQREEVIEFLEVAVRIV